jgi:arsenite methyltransferase
VSATKSSTPPVSKKANYGLDAPGVVRNLVLTAAIGFLAWPLGLAFEVVLWSRGPEPLRIIFPFQFVGPTVGALCLFLGSWMIYYSYFGKLRMREALLNSVTWRGDEIVLDVGCGRGLLLIGAAKRLTTGKATGIDLWQAEDLRGNHPAATLANAKAEGVADRVSIETGDARKLPFADASFDVVVSNAALHNIYKSDERRVALREIARVTKPGGRAILADIRNIPEYGSVLRECGFSDVSFHGSKSMALLLMILTFGSLKPGTVVGRK